MRSIKLIVAYDGTRYAGWQVQPNGLTIQEVLEDALATMLKEPVRVRSSGRTDAGVHARGMVAAFDTTVPIPVRAFSDGLNSLLPPDIAIQDAAEARPGFDPRREALSKQYRYTILLWPRRSPLDRLYAWHLRDWLDLAAMERAASLFAGEHDFAAFRTTGCAARTTRRRIDGVTLTRQDQLLIIDVVGSGFLKNMVRIMVGTLVEVGRGKIPPERVSQLLTAPETGPAGATAPPHGLCLMQVTY